MDKYGFSTNILELSESKTYLELKRRSCYYDYPNGNNVQLNSDNAAELAETLVNQPVVAKYKKIAGKDDLGGHEFSIDKNGDAVFDTTNIGVNTAVEVKNDDIELFSGEKVNTPCLFVTSRIWKRNKSVCAAIKRLFAAGKLHSSWEILVNKAEMVDGVKVLKDYVFEGDCFLGSKTTPAFGNCAETLSMASLEDDSEMLMAEALANDIYKAEEKEDNGEMPKQKETEIATEEKVKNTLVAEEISAETESSEAEKPADENVEVSDLTTNDLRMKITKACREKFEWCWIAFMFPNEKYVLVEVDGRESELEFQKFTYEVNGDEVTVGEPETVKLVVSVAEINNAIAEKDGVIEKANEALLKANEKIQNLQAEIDTLQPYKAEHEKAEAEKQAAELAEKQEKLKAYALKSGHITSEELENDKKIKTMISELDENGIKMLISDRFMASLDAKVETSEKEEMPTQAKASLDDSAEEKDYKAIMRSYLGK